MAVLLIVTGLAMGLAIVVYWAALIWRAPSEDEALRLSVSRTGARALALAFATDPSFCSLRGRGWFSGGKVMCDDVPLHLFKNRKVCDCEGFRCQPEADNYVECVSYEWDLDMLANPSNSISPSRPYNSISTRSRVCNKGWTTDNVRRRFAELGLTPLSETVLDCVGHRRRR